MSEIITPSQTVGPFFAYGLTPKGRAHWDPNGNYSWKETIGDNLVTPDASGERIIVHGHVLDEDKRPVPETLVEIWQANACGRYVHNVDQHPAPLDPNFTGAGRTITDKNGYYKFITVKPGAYPWGNHPNAWRPNHIHFSVFGQSFLTRLVTQMYFPGDPLFPFDPIFNSVTDEKARARMISSFDLENTIPDWALCFRWNIVLRGREATPLDTDKH